MPTDMLFIGRDKERQLFKQKLADPYGEDRIQYISGPGGIGKTWLLRAMLADARRWQSPEFQVVDALIDTYSTGNRHIEGVISTIVEQLNLPDSVLANYNQEKERLENARKQEGYAQTGLEARLNALAAAFRRDLQELVAEQPMVVAFDTFEHVSQTPTGRWILSPDGLQMPGLLCIVAGRDLAGQLALEGISDDLAIELYINYVFGPMDERRPKHEAYAIRLNKLAQRNPLLLALAAIWMGSKQPTDAELDSMDFAQFQRLIIGWLKPSHDKESKLKENARPAGSLFFLSDEELYEPFQQAIICMAYLNRRFNRPLLERLVEAGYVQGVTVTQLWEMLAEIPTDMKALDFFYVKGRPEGEIQLHDKLAEMLRLNILPDAFDDPSRQKMQQFANDVVDWYDELIAGATDNEHKAILQAEKLAYALRLDVLADIQQLEWRNTSEAKRLAQLLPPDFEKAKELLKEYQRDRSDILNRLIVNQITPETVMHFPLSEQYEFCSTLGSLALGVHDLRRTRGFWQQAVEIARQHNNSEQEIEALLGLFYGTWPESLTDALRILNQALPIVQEKVERLYPTILYWIGITYRRMQDLDEAIKWYEEALRIARQYGDKVITPTILNDMGYALILTGKYRRASVRIEMAARLRKQNYDLLEKEIEAVTEKLEFSIYETVKRDLIVQKTALEEKLYNATIDLGASYNTLGELFRYTGILDRATGYYSEALAIFNKLNSHYWQVQALHPRGDAHRRLSRNLFDQERIESSERYDSLAYEDILSSLELCEKYGFVESMARVYRRMGRLMHDRFFKTKDITKQEDFLNQAVSYLNQCLQVARDQHNVLEEMEALAEIAFLGDDLARLYRRQDPNNSLSLEQRKKIESIYLAPLRQGIKEHQKDRQRIFHFYVFENLLKMEEAALAYESGAYDNALHLYLESFTGLAQEPGYGVERCRRHFDHLFENIRRLPTLSLRKEWCERFIEKWKSTSMKRDDIATIAEAHPDLFEQFELYLDIGFVFS